MPETLIEMEMVVHMLNRVPGNLVTVSLDTSDEAMQGQPWFAFKVPERLAPKVGQRVTVTVTAAEGA